MTDLRSTLSRPNVYQAYQRFGGFHTAKLNALRQYLPIAAGSRVIDIGCGPGHMTEGLPLEVEYFGFDVDASYIEFAQRKFGRSYSFFCRLFDEAAAGEFGPADIVMLNGVLHHMDDAVAIRTLQLARAILRPGGRIFTLDGCYCDGQSRWAKLLLDWDRGRFVRSENGYLRLGEEACLDIESHVRSDLSWVPYTFIIMLGSQARTTSAER